jgi:hypothetical protein
MHRGHTIEKRDELLPSAICSESRCDLTELPHGIDAHFRVLALHLLHEEGDGVQRVVCKRTFVEGGESSTSAEAVVAAAGAPTAKEG